jgi:hypothetical protein
LKLVVVVSHCPACMRLAAKASPTATKIVAEKNNTAEKFLIIERN